MHEFTAPHMLSSSDAESVAIADLLALEPDAAERLFAQRLGYTESAGCARAARRSRVAVRDDDARRRDRRRGRRGGDLRRLPRAPAARRPRRRRDAVLRVGPPGRTIGRRRGDRVAPLGRDGWAHDLDALEAALRPGHAARLRQHAAQPDGAPHAAGGARSRRRALCRARCLALRRRGLPRARARPGRPPPRGRRPLRPGDLARLDVEDVRPARPPPRVAGLAGSHRSRAGSSISSTTRRSARAHRASSSALSRSGIATYSPIAVAPSCSPTSCCSTRSSSGTPIASRGCGRTRAPIGFVRVEGVEDTIVASVSSSSSMPACCSCPARCTTSRHMSGSVLAGPRMPEALRTVRSLDRNTFLTQRDRDPQTMRKVSEQPADTP